VSKHKRTIDTMEALCKESHVMLLNALTNKGQRMSDKAFVVTIMSASPEPGGQAIFGQYMNCSQKEVASRLRMIANMLDPATVMIDGRKFS
jgi:pentose-5-phosphate-3-epimerase